MGYEVKIKLTCEEKGCDNQIIESQWGSNLQGIINTLIRRFKRKKIDIEEPLCPKCLADNVGEYRGWWEYMK